MTFARLAYGVQVSDDDVGDDEMMERDAALAAAFRSLSGKKQEEKERELQLKNFRLRWKMTPFVCQNDGMFISMFARWFSSIDWNACI